LSQINLYYVFLVYGYDNLSVIQLCRVALSGIGCVHNFSFILL